jgi:hypothetical protein
MVGGREDMLVDIALDPVAERDSGRRVGFAQALEIG